MTGRQRLYWSLCFGFLELLSDGAVLFIWYLITKDKP